MKKILILHNNYKNYGGQNSNLENEILFLKKYYIVENITVKNSNKLNLKVLISLMLLSNSDSNKKLKSKLNDFKPNLVYVHNTWFTLNLGIFKILKKRKIKTVIKIHNFRYKCASSYFKKNHLKSESFCKSCNFDSSLNMLFNKYFQDSYLKSFFVIFFTRNYIKILRNNIFHIFSISNFHKNNLLEIGIKNNNIKLFFNPIEIPPKINYDPSSNYVIFAGRLTNEKGIDELLSAWINADLDGIILKIIGTGEILKELISKYNHKNIEFLGELENTLVLEQIKSARAVVTATKMHEGHSKLLSEASSVGVPSIFPKFGSMIEFFPDDYQLSFEQYNYDSLIEKIMKLDDKKLLEHLSITNYNFLKEKLDTEILISKFHEVLNYE